MKLFGDYNLADGSANGFYLYPKCFGTESGNCTQEEQQRFIDLMSEGNGVYFEIFVQEIYLDYEDFSYPLKKRQKKVYSNTVAYNVESKSFSGWDRYFYQ
jgi:hypothetical protein